MSLIAEAMPLWQRQPAPSRENLRRPEIIGLGCDGTGRDVAPLPGVGTPLGCGIDTYWPRRGTLCHAQNQACAD
jgi:hypothetical protein